MNPVPVGTRVRVIARSNHHSYTVGQIYTVDVVDNDGTFRARDASGKVGNWIRWGDVELGGPTLWDLVRKDLPRDIVLFLSAFHGVSALEVKEEVGDKILARLPDLDKRILAFARSADGARLLGLEDDDASTTTSEGEADEDLG
jgi:hypothetical protein